MLEKSCSPAELETYHALCHEFCDIFAWSYEEILGIDSSIVEHNIKMYLDIKLVREAFVLFIQRRLLP